MASFPPGPPLLSRRKRPSSLGITTYPDPQGITPVSGRVAGGLSVTITGVRFQTGATVLFGAVAGTNVVVVSSTTITVDSPAQAEGLVDITVTNPNGETRTLSDVFLYIAGHITRVSNPRGSVIGGTSLSIFGTNFLAGSTITIGGTAATSVVFVDETLYRCVTPAHVAGLVDIVITEPSATLVTGKNLFGYTAQIFGGDIRRRPSVTINESLGGGVNTASFVITGDGVPPAGAERTTFKDDAGNTLFGGQVTGISLSHEDSKTNRKWNVSASGWEWAFNRKRPFGLWNNVSASDVAEDIIGAFCPGFSTSFIQSRLPRISLVLDGTLDAITVFEKIGEKIGGGKFYIDPDKRCHLFAPPSNESLPPPSAMGFGAAALSVAVGTVSTLGMAFPPGFYYFYHSFRYGVAKTYTAPHFSIPIPPSPGYVQLSDEAADLNLTGTVSNGSYGLGFSRGWVMYDGAGGLVPEGWGILGTSGPPHIPRVAGDVVFATQDVATVLENLCGGGVFETRLSALAGPLYLDGFLPTFSSIPLGPVVGGRACSARIIYSVRMGDAQGVGGTSLEHYYTLEDNVTVGPITPIPVFTPTSVAARSYTPPLAPINVVTASETTDAVVIPLAMSRVAQTGYWSFRVTGVYQDGTESRGTAATAPRLFTGSSKARLTPIPVFPAIGGVTCLFRNVYASIYEPFIPVQEGVPDFSRGNTRKVAVITDNTSVELTFPFGVSIVGGERSDNSLPPGIEDEPGPNLESIVTPDDIDDANTDLLNDPPIEVSSDLTQLRNRIFVRGRGTILTRDAAVGDTTIQVSDVNSFSPSGGKLSVGHRVLDYTSLGGSVGAATIILSAPLSQPILQADWKFGGGTPIRPFVIVDELDSQRFFSLIEIDDDGNPSDGIHEYMLPDDGKLTTILQMIDAGIAETRAAWPILRVNYATRDAKTRKGRTVNIDLTDPPIAGTFVIDSVTIDQYYDDADDLQPRYNVQASTVGRLTLHSYLRSLGIKNDDLLTLSGATGAITSGTLPARTRSGYKNAVLTSTIAGTIISVGLSNSEGFAVSGGVTVSGKQNARGAWRAAGLAATGGANPLFETVSADKIGRLENAPVSIWRALTPTNVEMPLFSSVPAGQVGANNMQCHFGWGVGSFTSGLPTNRGVYFMMDGTRGQGWYVRIIDLVGTRTSNAIVTAVADTEYVFKMEALTTTSVRCWIGDVYYDATDLRFQPTDLLQHTGGIQVIFNTFPAIMWGSRLDWGCN